MISSIPANIIGEVTVYANWVEGEEKVYTSKNGKKITAVDERYFYMVENKYSFHTHLLQILLAFYSNLYLILIQ